MGNPRLALLAEPGEGPAPIIVKQMAQAVLALKAEGVTMVRAEQNLHLAARVADRAVVIEQGRAAWPRWKPVRQRKHGFWRSDPDRQLLRSPWRNRFV